MGKVFSWAGVNQRISPPYQNPGGEYNFVGVYLRFLNIDDPGKHYVIDSMGVAIDGDVFLVNGGKIKSNGVNHHDTSPINGYTVGGGRLIC